MKLDVTADEIARFDRDGFLVIEDALDAVSAPGTRDAGPDSGQQER